MQLINEPLLDRIRMLGYCEWCLKPTQMQVEASHTFGKGIGGGQRLDHPLNLTSLCRQCHQSHHDGNEPKSSDLVAIAALREGWAPQKAWEELYRLRRETR